MKDQYKVCEVSISYRTKIKPSERIRLACAESIYKLLIRDVFTPDIIEYKEYFKVLLLDNGCKLLGVHTVSEGGLTGTFVDVRNVLQASILSNARYIVLCHNHPSGECKPSLADDQMTQKIKSACNLLDIKVLDHIIVSSETYYSYADEGRIL